VSRIAAAFTKLVTSFVSDILLPIISLLPFLRRNMDEKFAVLRGGQQYKKGLRYNTLKQAQDDGALVMAYGYVAYLVCLLVVHRLGLQEKGHRDSCANGA